jgi:hypothetical protein
VKDTRIKEGAVVENDIVREVLAYAAGRDPIIRL